MNVTVEVTAEDTYTDPIYPLFLDYTGNMLEVYACRKDYGNLNISISGTWVGTIALQRSFDSGVTWGTVKTYTANAEDSITDYGHGVVYRAGCAIGAYTSGTANILLSN